MTVAAVILAGGRARRMDGADKAFLPLVGRPLIDRVIARLAGQATPVWISANGDPARFAASGLPVLADTVAGFAGPLAGIATALHAARDAGATHLASVAVDTPFFPRDLVSRLADGPSGEVAIARSGGRLHPVFALWPVTVAGSLDEAMRAKQARVADFALAGAHRIVDFDAVDVDPFLNVNTPDDLREATAILAGQTP